MTSGNGEVLERLIIEVVGDDSDLRKALEESIRFAQEAAEKLRDALAVDFSKLGQGAQQVGEAIDQLSPNFSQLNQVFDAYVESSKQGFDEVIRAGRMTEEQFEDYRRTVLETIETQRPLVQQLGVTTEAVDELARYVKEATYEQSQQSKETERTKEEQEELADVIKRISNEIRSSRNVWAGRITSDQEFRESTQASRQEIIDLLATVDRGSEEYRKLTQSLAYAQRGLDSVNKVASRGGLAWTAQIALANQFGQQLRGLGPAGAVAAGGLGLLQTGFSNLHKPLEFADFKLSGFVRQLIRLPNVLLLAASAVTVGLGVALTRLTAQAARTAQELENATHRTGLTIEGLQELQHAARQVGIPVEMLNTTMQRLQRRAADANAGNQGLKQSFDALGVSLTDSEGNMRTTEDLLGQVADGLNAVENNAQRLALAFKIFDTEGGRLLPLLTKGSEGINELRKQARELGLVISGDTVMSLSQVGSELDTVTQQLEVLKLETTAAFLPVVRDLIVPLLRDELVPWLGNVALRVQDFSENLFDTSQAGVVFRANVAKMMETFIALGKVVVTVAQVGISAINGLVSAGSFLGGLFGTLTSDVDFSAMRKSAEETADFWLARAIELDAQLLQVQDETQKKELQAAAEHAAEMSRIHSEAALELQGGRWGVAVQAAVDASIAATERTLGGLEGALDTMSFDFGDWLEDWVQNAAIDAGPEARKALTDLVQNAMGGALEAPPPEGSLAHAMAKLSEATKAYNLAVGEDARAAAAAVMEEWQAVIDAIREELESDPARDARLWTERLTAEMERGLKTPAQVLELISPTLEQLREKATNALSEFGFDSQEFRDANAQLAVFEAMVSSLESQSVDLTGPISEVRAEINENTLAAAEFLAEQAKNRQEAERILAVYEQLSLMGASLQDRMTFLEGTPFESALMTGPDLSDAVPLSGLTQGIQAVVVAQTEVERLRELIVAMLEAGEDDAAVLEQVHRLTQLSPMSVAALDDLTDGWYTARNATESYRQTAEEAFNEFPATPPVVATLTARLVPALNEAREQARALGLEFDFVASEQAILSGIITELGSKTNKTAGEIAVYEQAIARLAELNIAAAGAATDELFRAWMDGVNQMGVSLDPLDQAALALSELNLSAEQFAMAMDILAAAGDRLDQAEFEAALESWSESVAQLGVVADPIATARAELEKLFEGKTDLEEYRVAVELLADAEERLATARGQDQADQAAETWKSASQQISQYLKVTQASFDDLREAAEAAEKAGVISADELAQALAVIAGMELSENFRILAAELEGLQTLIPELAADFTQAFAQLAAGNTTDAIATAFNAAAQAVNALGDAFDDTANRGEAMLDMVIGAAAGIATAIGGPALGQAVGAVGNFIKSILGDLSNGIAEIQRQIDQTATRSTYLGEALIQGIAEGATSRVSRGGILGWLGFTKAELDQEAFKAGVEIAENIANGLVNTLRSGNFEEAWKKMTDDILIQGIIQQFMATDQIQMLIERVMNAVADGNRGQAALHLNRFKEEFREIWELIQEVIGGTDELPINVTNSLISGFTNALNSSTWEEAWQKSTLMMKNTLRDALIQAFLEGEAMKRIFDRFNAALDAALSDGVISEKELAELERIFAATEGPMQQLWLVLEKLGLSFEDLNETVSSVTSTMSNVPNVFLDTQATFDSQRPGAVSPGSFTQPGWGGLMVDNMPVPDRNTITINGDVYGWEDFETKVNEAVAQGRWRRDISVHGVSG